MVIGDELEVRHECSKALPDGERLRVDHKASELPLRRNEWIDLFRELLEVRFLKRTIRSDVKDISVAQRFKMNHRILPLGSLSRESLLGYFSKTDRRLCDA